MAIRIQIRMREVEFSPSEWTYSEYAVVLGGQYLAKMGYFWAINTISGGKLKEIEWPILVEN